MTTLCFVDTETTGLDPDRHEIWEVAIILRELDDHLLADLLEAGSRAVEDPESASSYVPIIVGGRRDHEYLWQLPVDLARADQIALNIGHFHERRWPEHVNRREARDGDWRNLDEKGGPVKGRLDVEDMGWWAAHFVDLTWGAFMIGMVPSFDTERLGRLVRKWGQCPGWHYQPIDVETLAVGAVLGGHPIRLTDDERDSFTPETLAKIDASQERGANWILERTALPWDSERLSGWFGIDADKYDRHSALGDARWARDLWDAIHEGVE